MRRLNLSKYRLQSVIIVHSMNLELITLEGPKIDQEVYEVMIPTVDGEIAVFPGHEALVTLAETGVIAIRRNKTDSDELLEDYAISGGVVTISNDSVRILVDEAEHGDDILESETKSALERAIKMRDEATDQVDIAKAHQLIDRHSVRLKVADLHRRRRRRQ